MSETWICQNCNTQQSNEHQYCPNCGNARFGVRPQTVRGFTVEPDSQFIGFQRMNRLRWWLWSLACWGSAFIVAVLAEITASSTLNFLSTVTAIGASIVLWNLYARRMHDTGRSAWWLLLLLVPIVNLFAFLAFSVMCGFEKSDPETNRWGPPRT